MVDLYVTKRATTDGPWGPPASVGGPVGIGNRRDVRVSRRMTWSSTSSPGGRAGTGTDDLWVTTRATANDPWGAPVNLGPTVNSPYDDAIPWHLA